MTRSPRVAAVQASMRAKPAAKAKKPAGPLPRWGLLDAVLAAVVALAVGSRTPVGGLAWYAAERLRGHGADLPTLTAYFSSGDVALPPLEGLQVVPAVSVIPADGVPEPWRSAARTVLAAEPLTAEATAAIAADPALSAAPEPALALLDRLYGGEMEPALERLALGDALRDRAIARARAAGDADPESYAVHRRYLPGDAQRAADRLVGGTLALATALDLYWPIDGEPRITSGFGMREHPTLGIQKLHNGVDLSAPVGTAVHAAQGGEIAIAKEDGLNGRYIVLDHGHGVRTSYCHLSEWAVADGDAVARGQVIAKSGNTGRSTGPHLHFTLKIGGKAVDPAQFHRVTR